MTEVSGWKKRLTKMSRGIPRGVCLVDSVNTCQAAVIVILTVTVQAVDEQKQS